MKRLYIIAVVAMSMCLTGCNRWLDINTNPNYVADADKAMLLPTIQLSVADKLGYDINLVGLFWSEYVTQNKNTNQYYTIMTYNLTNQDSSFRSPWSYFYTRVLPSIKTFLAKCDETGNENFILEGKAMLAYTLYMMTSLWDDVVYTEGYLSDELIVNPKFDSGKQMQETIIGILEDIRKISPDAAAAAEEASTSSTADMVFGGDTDAWFQFANTLYLKVLLRDFSANKSKIQSLLAEDNFLDHDCAFDNFSDQADKSNPLYESDRRQLNTNANIRCCIEILNVLSEDDPRLDAYYVNGAKGDVYGVTTDPSESTLFNITATQPVYFATADEALFLQAEAYARLGDAESAQSCYEAAIEASFDREGCAGAEEFIEGAYAFTAGSTEEMVEQIINQKWAANVHGNPIESWFDINRTGYPTVGKTISYSPGVSDGFPKRFLIPNSSTEYNSNSPAGKSLTDKMWWQK